MAELNERGQMILLFALVVTIVILTLSYVYAQNIIAGIESTRAMMAFPKEEIRNLRDIRDSGYYDVNRDLQILCAKNGWICYVSLNRVEFKSVEVDYCEGSDC